MIRLLLSSILISLTLHTLFAQSPNSTKSSTTYSTIPSDDVGGGCTTPNLDSATAVSLPYYGNNQVLEDYLIQNGYNDLEYISFPSQLQGRTNSTSFLEPNFLIPVNIYIYRDGVNDPTSSINEQEARNYICLVNEIYRNAGTAIQFYTNIIEFEANNFFNQQVSTNPHVYDLWARKRIVFNGSGKGINVHFIRYNSAPEDGFGKATLPGFLELPYNNYSCYVRTHNNPSGIQRTDVNIASTLAHEIGHTLGLLHTHHPGRLPSLVFNGENATIANGCYQESVSRVKRNYWYNGCVGTDNKLKCEINGDFLCDTQADPNQIGRVQACAYILPASGDFREDNWGDLWTPPTNNVMSYTTGDCRNEFSRHQTAIMWMQMPTLKNFIDYQQPQISSSSTIICPGVNQPITLSGTLPNDGSISWLVEPANLVTVSSGTGLTANLSALSSTVSGTATITFTITGPGNCYVARLQRSFWVGEPTIRYSRPGQNPCFSSPYYFTTPISGLSYNWSVDNPNVWIVSGNGASTVSIISLSPEIFTLTLDISGGSCSSTKSLTNQLSPGYYCQCFYDPWQCPEQGGGAQLFTVYPNPTINHLDILVDETEFKSPEFQSYEIVLFDKEGVEKYRSTTSEKSKRIDTSTFKNGQYYLHFLYKGFIVQRQIIINR